SQVAVVMLVLVVPADVLNEENRAARSVSIFAPRPLPSSWATSAITCGRSASPMPVTRTVTPTGAIDTELEVGLNEVSDIPVVSVYPAGVRVGRKPNFTAREPGTAYSTQENGAIFT